MTLYGMDRDLAAKAASKFDPKREEEAKEWIFKLTGIKCEIKLEDSLKSGVTLCK